MASQINTSTIDITYPIAGQDNDTQGFRTNFSSIVANFTTAALEITALQANVALFTAGTVTGNLAIAGNVTLSSVIQLANLTQTQVSAISSPQNGMMVYNSTYGNVQAYTSHLGRWGNVVIS
jgi:hypothetical protein